MLRLSLKMRRPTLPPLLYFVRHSNVFVLFTCQHAICSMAKRCGLGGMLCRLWNMNIHHLHVWGGKAGACTSMFMFICVGLAKGAADISVCLIHHWNTISDYGNSFSSCWIVLFSAGFLFLEGLLLGQSSVHTASCYMGHAWVPWQQLCLHRD